MREMLQSPSQHYTRLTNLLRRIKDSPEASQELMRWGLTLDPDIHRVGAAGCWALSFPHPGNGGNGCTGAARDFCSFQTQGRVLPAERINMRHSSFIPTEDLSWNREVTREASISAVSPLLGRCNNIPLFENWDGFS